METCFEDMNNFKKAVKMELRKILKESFQECIQAWQRMEKCVTQGTLLWRRYEVRSLSLKYISFVPPVQELS